MRGGRLTRAGAVLLAVGVVATVVGLIGLVPAWLTLGRGFSDKVPTPTVISHELDAGTAYAINEDVGAYVTNRDAPMVSAFAPGDITVTGPGGIAVPVTPVATQGSSFRDGRTSFVESWTFVAPVSGTYAIAIATHGPRVELSPASSMLDRAMLWTGLAGLGVVAMAFGAVLLVVGRVQRSRAPAVVAVAPTVGGAPSAGWYADVDRPGGWRYWDGASWTDLRS
jgi:hypothetical protein